MTIKGCEMIKYKMIHNCMDDIIKFKVVFSDAASFMLAIKNIKASVEIDIIEFENNMSDKTIRNVLVVC